MRTTMEKVRRLVKMPLDNNNVKQVTRQLGIRRENKIITYSKNVTVPLIKICRNECGYCNFASGNGGAREKILSPLQVIKLLKIAQKNDCKEVLFILGENPEKRTPDVNKILNRWGYKNVLDYLNGMCKTALGLGLLPHTNAGLMDKPAMLRLHRVNASMGLMLESTNFNLSLPGGPHEKSPGKQPLLRLKHIVQAGKLKIPFTTGILVGIGETFTDRLKSLLLLKKVNQKYGHIQEIIIQNFCAKENTGMAQYPEPTFGDLLKTVMMARLIFGTKMNIQCPPNLSQGLYPLLLHAGINDWGGVSPVSADPVNSEKQWPSVSMLQTATEREGFILKERLAIYKTYIAKSWYSPLVGNVIKKQLRSIQGKAK